MRLGIHYGYFCEYFTDDGSNEIILQYMRCFFVLIMKGAFQTFRQSIYSKIDQLTGVYGRDGKDFE